MATLVVTVLVLVPAYIDHEPVRPCGATEELTACTCRH